MAFFRFVVLFILLSSTPCFASSSSTSKVTLSIYYESACDLCANFILNYVPQIFENGLISIVNLDLVPFGDTKILANGSFTCKERPELGSSLCFLNTLEACAINTLPNLQERYNFVSCTEGLLFEHRVRDWESCFQTTGVDKKVVMDCYGSGYGQKLELQYAAQTNALQPPHRYLPWVTLDGKPLYDNYRNFEAYICRAYKGVLPKACEEFLSVPQEMKELKQAAI